MPLSLTPIATVRSSRAVHLDGYWRDLSAIIELDAAFSEDAFAGLETFSHLEVIFFMDRIAPEKIHRGRHR